MLAPAALSAKARALPGLNTANVENTVLSAIINAKAEFLEGFTPAPAPAQAPEQRSLKAALSGPGRHFILECKRASPSLGDINLGLDLNALIKTYNRYAAAVSVLTEQTYFKGSYAFLQQVKAQTTLPVILKDFVVDPRELINAKNIGADAVLLMTSVLSHEMFMALYKLAYSLGLEVLCEVSTEEEARFAREQGLQIVGINNRDLRTLTIDLTAALRLKDYFGPETVLVSESGIKCHQDLVRMHGLSNFLIGSAVCANTERFDLAVKTLLYGCNKICGLADAAGVKAAIDAKAALAGLIFYPPSPRAVDLNKARQLMAVDTEGVLTFCGVFLDAALDEVIDTVKALNLPYVQLHGRESPEYIRKLKKALPHVRIIKAIAVKDASFKAAAAVYQDLGITLLFDSKAPGSGQSFDHELLHGVSRVNALLSGGIGADNVQAALAEGFCGLDLNSKLERAPGQKDPALTAAVFAQINQY